VDAATDMIHSGSTRQCKQRLERLPEVTQAIAGLHGEGEFE